MLLPFLEASYTYFEGDVSAIVERILYIVPYVEGPHPLLKYSW
jgi:hypothetical protein